MMCVTANTGDRAVSKMVFMSALTECFPFGETMTAGAGVILLKIASGRVGNACPHFE